MKQDTVIAVDTAKIVFQIGVSRQPGRIAEHHRLKRKDFLPFMQNQPPCIVVMEACGSSHHWAKRLQAIGHVVVLLPPHAVRPYVRRNKTDRADVKGLLEAYRNGDIHPVPVKTAEQQTLTALHRLRAGWMADRTAKLNTLRGLLRERGYFMSVGADKVIPEVWMAIEDADLDLPLPLRTLFAELCRQVRDIEAQIQATEKHLEEFASESDLVKRLMTIPGVGLLTATAIAAFVGDLRRFPSARHFGSYLGLTPREFSSGLRRRLGGISKRGDVYLRQLLIHGARAVLNAANRSAQKTDRLRTWALELQKRTRHNTAAVALANKMARIVWAVGTSDRSYRSVPADESPRSAA